MTETVAPLRLTEAATALAAGPGFEVYDPECDALLGGDARLALVAATDARLALRRPVMSKGLTPGAVLPDFALPSPSQLWEDLQDLLRRTKADFDPTSAQARAAWKASRPAGVGVSGHA